MIPPIELLLKLHRLPQKSGFPQEKINEIHGAWYDPSNPVVPFSGSLRGDLFNWMIEIEKVTSFISFIHSYLCCYLANIAILSSFPLF